MVEILDLSGNEEYSNDGPTFFGAMLADILRIKEILDPVFPFDINVWQTYFRHYRNPGSEIRWWLFFAEEYSERTDGMSHDECHRVFLEMLKKKTLV